MKKRIIFFFQLANNFHLNNNLDFSLSYLSADKGLSFNIKNIYIFNCISSSVIYAVLEFVFKKNKDYVGNAYLYGAFIKLLTFSIIFNKIYLSKISLSFYEKMVFDFRFFILSFFRNMVCNC